ncbi:MAG: tRNA lysidine(34) synthetase TilS [Gammaproteobacteria bacterium]
MSSARSSRAPSPLAAAEAALERIVESSASSELVVAYSGGCDSSVLLELVAGYAARRGLGVCAVHVDHGLDAGSHERARFCARAAAQSGIDARSLEVDGGPAPGQSVEAWARAARYARLAEVLPPGGCLLTAHHADDQAETVLLRALAGAGPHGLAAMRELRPFHHGFLGRPLLGLSRRDIEACARARGITWVDDPGNDDPRFRRNRLRRDALPALEYAQPGAVAGLRRLAALQRELADGIDRLCDQLTDAATGVPARLPLDLLAANEAWLRPFLLKRALVRSRLPVCGQRHLEEILARLVGARRDASPLVAWSGAEARRYRETLYLMRPLAPAPPPEASWLLDVARGLELPWGRLSLGPAGGPALSARQVSGARLEVGFRRGGEQLVPAGRRHRRALKKLFQEWGVPPWERSRTPLLYVDGELAAVGDRCVTAPFAAQPGAEEGRAVRWEPAWEAADGGLSPA